MDKVCSSCYEKNVASPDSSLFPFQAFDSSVSRDQVIALLREHIQSNTIKVCGSN